MRTVAEQALMLALSLALLLLFASNGNMGSALTGSSIAHAIGAGIIAGLLLALSAAGLFEWLIRGPWAWAPVFVYSLAVIAVPDWMVFLPLLAYDAGRLPRASTLRISLNISAAAEPSTWFSRERTTPYAMIAFRWLWLIALPVSALRLHARTAELIVAAGITALGFALGVRARHEADLRRTLRTLQDKARKSNRSSRLRLADMDEERAQSVRMATLNERTRIAREIHDNVGHLLTRAIMQAQAGKAVADATGDTTASQGFSALSETLNDAMTMVRRSVHDLEDDGTDFTAQISAAVTSFDRVSPGFSVQLENDIASAPAPVSRCFATVIRESLSNVVHHSQARTARVTLRDFPAFWQLVIQDAGPANTAGNTHTHNRIASAENSPLSVEELSRGMGLADIESRVRAIGGTSLCGPYDGGWRVFVSVPKKQWVAVESRES